MSDDQTIIDTIPADDQSLTNDTDGDTVSVPTAPTEQPEAKELTVYQLGDTVSVSNDDKSPAQECVIAGCHNSSEGEAWYTVRFASGNRLDVNADLSVRGE